MTPSPTPYPPASADLASLLTPDLLSALMRSTWTWDDRALRRDLSQLLVDREAADGIAGDVDARFAVALQAKSRLSGASFAATVLGANLLVENDNPLQVNFASAAVDPGRYAREYAAAFTHVVDGCRTYVDNQVLGIEYADEALWLPMVAEAGAGGLSTAMRAYGYNLTSTSFFGNVAVAWQALTAISGSPVASDLARQLVLGNITATLAAAEKAGSWDPALVSAKAIPTSSGWRLSGAKQLVPAASTADILLIIARSVAGPSLFAVEASAPGLRVAEQKGIDESRPLFEVILSDTPAQLIDGEGRAGRLMSGVINLATTALAAEQVGLIERAMGALTANGVPAQQLADRALDHATAVSLWQRAVEHPSPAAAAAAHIGCSQAAVNTATTLAQLSASPETDGIVRRAISASMLFGGPALAYERLLERLGI